jgi:hypothetical protein
MKECVFIGDEELDDISSEGLIPENDGPTMGLPTAEMIAAANKTLFEMVDNLLKDVGPAMYERVDLHLSRPVAKAEMTEFLLKKALNEIGGQKVEEVSQRDGVKYIMGDD